MGEDSEFSERVPGVRPPQEKNEEVHPTLHFSDKTAYVGVQYNGKYRLVTDSPEMINPDKVDLSCKPVTPKNGWSPKEVYRFLSGKEIVNPPKQMFKEVRGQFKKYIDFPADEYYDVLALWVVGTFFFMLFNTYPYIHLTGMMSSGKTKCGKLAILMSFNGRESSSISPAALFRIVHNSRCSLFIDEAEAISRRDDKNDFRLLLNSGYKRGGTAVRCEGDDNAPTEFDTYSPKIIGNIGGMDNVLTSRCLQVVMTKTLNPKLGRKEVDIYNSDWTFVRDSLYEFMMFHWKDVKQIYEGIDKKIPEEITNRDLELWKPILTIAKFVDVKLFNKLLKFALSKTDEQKKFDIIEQSEVILISALSELVGEDQYYLLKDIRAIVLEKFDDEQKWLTSKWVSKVLRRLGFSEFVRRGDGTHVLLTKTEVELVCKRYGIGIPKNASQSSLTSQDEVKETRIGEGSDDPPLLNLLEVKNE